jgi:hypothetical protein
MTRISISLSDWIMSDIIGKTDNTSARIQELVIKGYMAEKQKLYIISEKSEKTGQNSPVVSRFIPETLRNFLGNTYKGIALAES